MDTITRHIFLADPNRPKSLTTASWILQILAAAILLQTLFFKFTGAEEAKFIFSTLGVEPWGRIGTGIIELFVGVILLIPRTATLGALGALGLMAGAIASHLTILGIEVKDDGGLLFALAIVVTIASVAILFIRRRQIPLIGPRFAAPAR